MDWKTFNAVDRSKIRGEWIRMLRRQYGACLSVKNDLPVLTGVSKDPHFILYMQNMAEGHGCSFNAETGEFLDLGISLP